MSLQHRAARLHTLGGTPQIDSVGPLQRRPGHTLVSVTASAVNPADLLMARGYYPGPLPRLPFVVGLEGTGHVLESEAHPAGTPVWWQAPGAAATFAVVPTNALFLCLGMSISRPPRA